MADTLSLVQVAASSAIATGVITRLFVREAATAGTINEIFDAQPPYNPRGCFAQAWSVSEVLRLLRTP